MAKHRNFLPKEHIAFHPNFQGLVESYNNEGKEEVFFQMNFLRRFNHRVRKENAQEEHRDLGQNYSQSGVLSPNHKCRLVAPNLPHFVLRLNA